MEFAHGICTGASNVTHEPPNSAKEKALINEVCCTPTGNFITLTLFAKTKII